MPPKDYKSTICWECRNAYGRCSWSKDFTPVDGWSAEPTEIKGVGRNTTTTNSYIVKSCPLFKED